MVTDLALSRKKRELVATEEIHAASLKELDYMAYSGMQELVHGNFKSIPTGERWKYSNKYVLHQVVLGGIIKLRRLLSASAEKAAQNEKDFIDNTIRYFLSSCVSDGKYPRELYESLLAWSRELVKLTLLSEAADHLKNGVDLGVARFPDLHCEFLFLQADLLATRGKHSESFLILSYLAERPYLNPQRNLIPEILITLGRVALLAEETAYGKSILFHGLRYFYTNIDQRRLIVDRLCGLFRHSYNILLSGDVSISDKFLFFIHWIHTRFSRFRITRILGLSGALNFALLSYIYLLTSPGRSLDFAAGLPDRNLHAIENNTPASTPVWIKGNGHKKPAHDNILVTRAMGGIGDLLMLTPGLHALKQKFPDSEIHLAIPRRYFPVFLGNEDVVVEDIDNGVFHQRTYSKWFNFTDCPAARIESRTAPRVKESRIDIFARGLGVRGNLFRRMKRRPRYFISEEERRLQREFWDLHDLFGKTVIGVQYRSDESYRDFRDMDGLVRILSRSFAVLVFDHDIIPDCNYENVIKVEALPVRDAFAIAEGCDAIVAPDSAFIHLAAALDIPCVGLFGPIDGRVRTKYYSKCEAVDVRANLKCIPCWRNEKIPCKLTNMRSSVCMSVLPIAKIREALDEAIKGALPREKSV